MNPLLGFLKSLNMYTVQLVHPDGDGRGRGGGGTLILSCRLSTNILHFLIDLKTKIMHRLILTRKEFPDCEIHRLW